MENVIIREYQPGDEAGILALYHAVFGVTLSSETWKWFYQDVPEHPTVIVVAENSSGIVGHYGIQPRPFWHCGQPCLAGLTVGTMVHPMARNLTTLVEMAQMAYDRCRQQGISFLYSFSRDEAWKVRQVVLGWQALPQLIAWEGPLSNSDNNQSIAINIEDSSIENFQTFCSTTEVESYRGIGRRITPTWINWRFSRNPLSHYKLLIAGSVENIKGYAVLKVYDKQGVRWGHVVDWQVPVAEPSIAKALFAATETKFMQLKVDRLSCWALPRSSLAYLLQTAGLTPTGQATNFGYLNLALEDESMLETEKNWNIYMGDSDVY
jgi:hypothetical protein